MDVAFKPYLTQKYLTHGCSLVIERLLRIHEALHLIPAPQMIIIIICPSIYHNPEY
jgi:hypothetical protein